ncbi:MAG: DUF1223 domain-containing protein [Sinobacteraceae bacterium]|nr:DUF1223 domain-containing protein [Nevskiaceae bacterium]MBV9316561.1 DUF1223 domain-containing protein [Gammaproteobacteria bacterium]
MPATLLRALVALAALGCSVTVMAQPRPLVIELFTSQGCSSCPPAEAYLGKLSTRADVVALAFHVDYWDDLGWRDRFELPQSVTRQNIYARNLQHASVYTPQLVIDGRSDAVGADERAVAGALAAPRPQVPLTISRADAVLRIDMGAQPQGAACDVWLAAYRRHALSAIGRGENAGRNLEEFNIVRELRYLGPWQGEQRAFLVPLSSLPSDSTDVAVLIQRTGQGPMVGAAAHALQ